MLIAEVGLTHDGSLGNALAFIDAVADAGADAVKFQDHLGDTNSQPPQSGCDLPQDLDRSAYWKRTGFDGIGWVKLRDKAHSRNLTFGITPFSLAALERSAPLVDFIKISRNHHDLLPAAIEYCHNSVREVDVIATTTDLTKPRDDIGLAWLSLDTFKLPASHRPRLAGISDHSGKIWPCLRAAAWFANVFEVHVCWDRRQFGPDIPYSITIDELATLAEGIKAVCTG